MQLCTLRLKKQNTCLMDCMNALSGNCIKKLSLVHLLRYTVVALSGAYHGLHYETENKLLSRRCVSVSYQFFHLAPLCHHRLSKVRSMVPLGICCCPSVFCCYLSRSTRARSASCIWLLHPAPILVPKMVLTLCNLRWWCFSFHQLANILHLQSWSSSPAATCAGGVFPWSTNAFTNVRTNE